MQTTAPTNAKRVRRVGPLDLPAPVKQSPCTMLIGRSVEGRVIRTAVNVPTRRRPTLILGGFHGDEPKSVHVAQRLIDALAADSRAATTSWIVVPVVNPDGYARRQRRNARSVDLNRNFPTQNWALGDPRSRMYGGPRPASEPETRALIRLIRRYRPIRIITIHSIDRDRFCNNYDGPGEALAQLLARYNRYPLTAAIGYPTPGSFGTWAGVERRIATVTLELPSRHSPKRCADDNLAGLMAAIFMPHKNLPRATQRAVLV